MSAQAHTPSPRAPRIADMTDKELLAHSYRCLERAQENQHWIAAATLTARIAILKAKIKRDEAQP